MSTLFELDDFVETQASWRILSDWSLCGLCGGKQQWNQGGTQVGGGICDGCAEVDRCEEMHGRHVSHWGYVHPVDQHDRLIDERSRRRARYFARLSADSSNGDGS